MDSTAISGKLADNLQMLEQVFMNSSDLVYNHWNYGPDYSQSACSIYYNSLVQDQQVNYMKASLQDLITHEIGPGTEVTLADFIAFFDQHGVSSQIAKPLQSFEQAVNLITEGYVLIFVDGWNKAISYKASNVEARQVAEPVNESVVQGPREGLVESLQKNQGLLRKRLKSPKFKMVTLHGGGETNTTVVYGFLEGAVNEEALSLLKSRIADIGELEILETSYIEELIEDVAFSPFPQNRHTERPDVAVAALLDGKIIVMVDGTCSLMICPGLFTEFFQSSEDYYQRSVISTMIRLLRILAFGIALTLPSIYIALTTFHTELIPTVLLLAIIDAREGIPLPAFFEALTMEIFFELLREAGVRLPKPVGSAVSIVGALVIGEAAITAGIASPSMVVVVALTGIASFAIPQYNIAVAMRILRFPLMLISSWLGGFGLMIGLLLILLHLCTIRTLGQPYMMALSPLNLKQWRDIFIRVSLKSLIRSPRIRHLRHEKK